MSAIIPNKLVLHEEMDPLGSQCQRIKYESKAGTAKAAGISTIHVPSSRNAYMKCRNSWLNFSVKCNVNGTLLPTATTNSGNLELDPMGAAVFIQKITVLQNDLPVAVLDNYSQIHSILQVSQATAASAGVRSAIDGSSWGMNGVRNTLKGNRIRDWAGPFPAVSTSTACVTPLMSFSLPIVGLLSSANLPMCLLKGGIEIRINWRDDVRKIFTTNAKTSTETVSITDKGSMEFSNITWDAEITTMDDSSQLEVAKENKFESGTVEWSDVFYYAFTNQVPVAQLSTATIVNTIVAGFRYKSLRTIYHAGFALPTSKQFDSVNVPHIFWNDIQYRVAGVEHPKQKIDTLAEVVQQNVASQSNVSQSCVTGLMAHGFTSLNWRPTESVPTVQTRFTDRGVSAVNLESFPDIHNISGVDTTGADVECTFNTIGDGLTTSTLNISQAWVAAFDCIYTIRDGVLRRSN
jgi:hypothetical protein